jgi:tetrahydromethanopterin S-methyltransferase subunit A
MSKLDENLSNMLNIPKMDEDAPVITVDNNEKPVVNANEKMLEDDLMVDYNESRKKLKEIVDKGAGAIDDILAIARESEHPRAFEVAATLIKNVTDANEKLLTIQKQMRDITGAKNNGSLNVGKAAIFVGSTAELSKMLKGEKEKLVDGDK